MQPQHQQATAAPAGHAFPADMMQGDMGQGDMVKAGGFGVASSTRGGGETRRALITCALAMYPLVGSATIILAAIMLAGGAQAG